MRKITASDDVAPLIDRGADVDAKLKAYTADDKAVKKDLVLVLSKELAEDETSVRVEGNTAAVIVTATEKATIKVGAEEFKSLRGAVVDGLLPIVSMNQSLTVPPAKVEEAAKILKEAGIVATVSETFAVKAADVRKLKEQEAGSIEEVTARKYLGACLDTDTSHRIKYEPIKPEGE